MENDCSEMRPVLGALADRELSGAMARRVEDHAAACASCGAELEATRALSRRLGGLRLPETPVRFRPERPGRWRYLPGTAAAALLAAVLFLAVPGPIPDLVALTTELHQDHLGEPAALRQLDLRLHLPESVTECACPADLSPASPFFVYRTGDTVLSVLLTDRIPGPLPDSAARAADGRDYHFFKGARSNAIVGRSGSVSHIWVSRLDEREMLRAILKTREGSDLFGNERPDLHGLT